MHNIFYSWYCVCFALLKWKYGGADICINAGNSSSDFKYAFSSQIGIGDGIMIITLGLFMNCSVIYFQHWYWAFIFVSLIAIFKVLSNKKTTIPLAPFLLIGQICVIVNNLRGWECKMKYKKRVEDRVEVYGKL